MATKAQTPLYGKTITWQAEQQTTADIKAESEARSYQNYLHNIKEDTQSDWVMERIVKRVEKLYEPREWVRPELPYEPEAEYEYDLNSYFLQRINSWTYGYHMAQYGEFDQDKFWENQFHIEETLMEEDYEAHKKQRYQDWGWNEVDPFSNVIQLGSVGIAVFKKAINKLKKYAYQNIDVDHPFKHYEYSHFIDITPRRYAFLLEAQGENKETEVVDYYAGNSTVSYPVKTVRVSAQWLTNPRATKHKGVLDFDKEGVAHLSIDIEQDLFIVRIGSFTARFPYNQIKLNNEVK